MAHHVGDVQSHVMLIEAEHVVDIAADAIAWQIMDGETAVRHHGQAPRQKARLDALGQLQFAVDLLMELLQTLVEAAQLGALVGQAIVGFLFRHITVPFVTVACTRNAPHPPG